MAARLPLLLMISDFTGTPARLLHGGLNDVQGEPYGRLFIALGTADLQRVKTTLNHLQPLAAAVEVLGYVPSHV